MTNRLPSLAIQPGQLSNSVLAILFHELAWHVPEAEMVLLYAWSLAARSRMARTPGSFSRIGEFHT